jgi:coenzyme F420-reducing hydrogenase delta subunit
MAEIEGSKSLRDEDLVVVAFACTYCAYTAADLAGALRLTYPARVRIIQVPCSGRVDAALLLRTFAEGADAIFVAGCNLGDCHFLEGNVRAKEEVGRCRQLLTEVGLGPQRLEFFHVPASAGALFAERAREMTERAQKLGPNPLRASLRADYGGKLRRSTPGGPSLAGSRLGQVIRQEEREAGLGEDHQLCEVPEGALGWQEQGEVSSGPAG